MHNGKFVISLDFELFWGVRDTKDKNEYAENIRGVQEVIPKLLELFERFHINVTFSTVGFLFFESKKELLAGLPPKQPEYVKKEYSPYHNYFDKVGDCAADDPFHYAPNLIRKIRQYPNHEIGTHTLSHFFCLEDGQTIEDFRYDLIYAQKAADKYGIKLTSLVFPRGQYNHDYLTVCRELGILSVRGNENSWLYKARKAGDETMIRRAARLADSYFNITGQHCFTNDFIYHDHSLPIELPSSRFLRPVNMKLPYLNKLHLNRIRNSMTHAAKNKLSYHLWWHPHNFGINQDENIRQLIKILMHYERLNKEYAFQSYTMTGLAEYLITDEMKRSSSIS